MTDTLAPRNVAQVAALDSSLAHLFAVPVAVATACPSSSSELLPAERFAVAGAVDRRRHEYATVRACARQALHALGHSHAKWIAIPSGADREPLWPEGYVGSLSHSSQLCCAAVALQSSTQSLGIDVECNVEMDSSMIDAICSPAEIDEASRVQAISPNQFSLLAFSAKEAFYKAYFPLTRHFLDFADVLLKLQSGDKSGGTFSISLRAGLPLSGREGRFVGKWLKRENNLFTGVTLL